MSAAPSPTEPPSGRHLWQIRSVREVAVLAALILVAWLAYSMRAILIPVLVAFALAYVVDPVIRHTSRALSTPRVVPTAGLVVVLVALAAGFFVWVAPALVDQADRLAERLPNYLEVLSDKYDIEFKDFGIDVEELRGQVAENPREVVQAALRGTGRLFGIVGSVLGMSMYLLVSFVLILALFPLFCAKYDAVQRVYAYVPASRRGRVRELMAKIDEIFSSFVRGQFVVALFTTIGFCIGFYLADVPYWFVVSLIGGTLSLIPYGQMSGWVLAVSLKYLETQAGAESPAFSWWAVVLAPSLVYAVTQSMESWVITPLVQGQATNMHPVVVLVVLLIGGSLAGFLGLLLAIPVAASARVLFEELLAPRWREWAHEH